MVLSQALITKQSRPTRIEVNAGEALRLPMTPLTIRVRSGDAWITLDHEDIIAQDGQTVTLRKGQYPAVITALGAQTVILEVAQMNFQLKKEKQKRPQIL